METLNDGTKVTLRAAQRDDGPKIRQAFHNLGPETIYTRFFGPKSDVSEAELHRFTNVDFEHDVALLVMLGSGDKEIVIGEASYFALDPEDPLRSAEVSFTVEEEYQGRGIASVLMQHIVQIARENGLLSLEAEVLVRNLPMLEVFRRCGLPMTVEQDGDVVHVTLSVQPAEAD